MKYNLLLIALVALTGTSCKKWLEIQPKSEVPAEVLFETPVGFSIALNGIYTTISAPHLYGKELKFGFVDVLARSYDTRNSVYDGLKNYDYVSGGMSQVIQQIWSNSYNAIANCNALLENLEQKPADFFTTEQRNMLEGETRAIRAMLYFDLLRLFAPAPIVEDVAAIPYYGEISNEPRPYIKTSVILEHILEDLKTSQRLQRAFDTTPEAEANFSRDRFMFDRGFFSNSRRGFRMGYYATSAILARAALYAGQHTLALQEASALIGDKKPDGSPTIDLTSPTIVDVGAYDRMLSEDIIFALYRDDYENQFNHVIFLTPNTGSIYGSEMNTDYRKKAYHTVDGFQVLKFDKTQEREGDITSAIPMIRLSEMYYIAAEAAYETDPVAALNFLNTLRTKRGSPIALSPFPSKDALLNAIINDARREFIGEGQLFYLYKRLNKTVLDEFGGHRQLTDEFILPVPEREVSLED